MMATAIENSNGVLRVQDADGKAAAGTSREETPRKKERAESRQLAEAVASYLNTHLETHTTIAQLATMFHVSQTQLKTSFKDAFHVSVYGYARSQKMHAAARVLRETQSTVLEVAGQFGYSNGSKFAKAFRDEMGATPKVYRQAHRDK